MASLLASGTAALGHHTTQEPLSDCARQRRQARLHAHLRWVLAAFQPDKVSPGDAERARVHRFAGKLWTRSQKVAYTLLNKLSSRNEPLLMPGDRVSSEMKRPCESCLQSQATRRLTQLKAVIFDSYGAARRASSRLLAKNYTVVFFKWSAFVTCCVCLSVCCLQVALVFPNNDPVMFMVAFYGCLLAELVPVPIEVPLTRKVTAQNGCGAALTPAECLTFPLKNSTIFPNFRRSI